MRAICGVGLAVGRQPSKLIYTGSIPVPRFSECAALGRGSKAGVAQLVEHRICNRPQWALLVHKPKGRGALAAVFACVL
jgi:hypothetical protein